jgi:hypothetical protein
LHPIAIAPGRHGDLVERFGELDRRQAEPRLQSADIEKVLV